LANYPGLLHITTVSMSLTFLQGQVQFMRERGFHVEALCSPGPETAGFEQNEGVHVHTVEMPRRITPWQDLEAVRNIVAVIRQTHPTIVHAHTPKGGLLGMIAAFVARVPVRIYHMRGLPLMGASGSKKAILWLTEWLACRLAHRVLCVSHSLREVAIGQGICPPDKIRVMAGGSGQGVDAMGRFNPANLPNGIRAEVRLRFGIPEDAVVIGFVGRLVRDKGIVELATAWADLRQRYPSAHLLMVGPFEPQDPIPASIRETLEADNRVHLAGMDWNTPPLFSAMDIVALPTYREGFPNVPLEAAAMRLPVVATRIPGCIDAVVDGVTGTLVAPRDPEALRDALGRYLSGEQLRAEHGRAGSDRVIREFRQEVIWEAIADEYHALMRQLTPALVSKRRSPRPTMSSTRT
jgi:glycosyltransferase involved in cell wall biosynthesis